jgi:hypothetical protein
MGRAPPLRTPACIYEGTSVFTPSNIGIAVEKSQDDSTDPPAVEIASSNVRERAIRAAKWFNIPASWMPLAVALKEIKQHKVYQVWGFRSFSAYVEGELDIRKNTAAEIMLAYEYLMGHHPESSAAEHLPSYANLTLLARAAAKLPEDVVANLDEMLFAGNMKRKALKEAIDKALRVAPEDARAPSTASVERQAPDQDLLDALLEFYQTTDLDILEEEINVVFDDWGTDNIAERRQLVTRLHELLEALQDIRARLTDLTA